MLVIKIQENAEDIDTFPTSEKDVTEENLPRLVYPFSIWDGTFLHFRRDSPAEGMFKMASEAKKGGEIGNGLQRKKTREEK